ncbi:hypothetical protein LCGC14_0963240 [marine sediment metagenome]|uniref:Uncharacterized protein n=1 Tax=marine sediment metagenome TaxID=412755 RepID=A0A0F9QX06_9ZZZZ
MKFKNRTMPEICHDLAEMLIVKWNFKTIAGKKIDRHAIFIVIDAHGEDLSAVGGGQTDRQGFLIKTKFNESL